MKIFSSFDTKLASELYNKEVTKFGDEKVLIVHRDPIYIRLKIVIPMIVWAIVLILMIYITVRLSNNDTISSWIINAGMIMIIIV
jgi:hypothetical protein